MIDIDGTIFIHNGHLEGEDKPIQKSIEFIANIPEEDMIILMTARKEKYRENTITALKKNNIRYDKIIFDIPAGERIVINDKKPSGLETAIGINLERNIGIDIKCKFLK